MASKFWGRGSDSEDESEEEVTSSSEEESSSDDDSDSSSSSGSSSSGSSSDSDDSDKPKKGGASRFLMGSSESESEDERRVVKSAKDKAQDELTSVCNEIRNKMHINDWAAIQTLFDKLNKQLEKTQKITQTLGTPRVYVKLLVELEDFLSKTLQEKPKLSPTNTRALTRMKQTLRKHNAAYAEQMAAFRANPVSESEASEASESEEGSDESDSEDGEGGEGSDDGEGKFKTVRTGVVARPKDKILFMDPKEITYEMVQKKLREVALARGKTSSLDRAEHVEMLTYLASVAKGPVQRLEVLIHIITVTFDMNQPMHAAMTVPNWNRCAATLFDTLSLMAANPHIVLVDQPPEEEGERGAEPPVGEPVHVWGNLASFLERLDDEWTSSLKNLDPHANEYMDRLKDETILLALAQKVSDYLSATGQHDKLAAVALKRIEHFYYKTAVVYGAMRKLAAIQQAESAAAAAAAAAAPAEDGAEAADGVEGAGAGLPAVRVVLPADFSLPESCGTLLEELSRVVYAHGNDNQKGQAMLCGVYFRCIHDDFYGARDMLLMSRIQEQTQQLENRMQVLFNRTMAQLGLCAFRAGLVPEAHQCLDTLYGTGRVKELLAQGIQQHRFQEKTAEQEAAERRRQVPFHMHINLELLETVYLTAAMLLEVPNIAALGPLESRKRIISKPLRRLMENYERQTFVGPPESVRDHMMAACRSLATGDWRRCYGYVTALTCWQLVPQREQVLGMLRAKVQAEGLRTYLLAYSKYYSSLSMAQLCDMFELPERQVHALVSRLMAEEQLPGSHDQPTGTIVMQNVEPSRVQVLAGQFADKAALLVDLNERALALRTGGVNQEDEEGEGRRGPQDMQGGRRTRMGGRGPFAPGASGRGDRGGRGGGRGGGGGGGGGRGVRFGADRLGLGRVEEGYSGGVFGRGRARQQRDDNNLHRLGSYGGRAGRV